MYLPNTLIFVNIIIPMNHNSSWNINDGVSIFNKIDQDLQKGYNIR